MKIDLDRVEVSAELRLGLKAIDVYEKRYPMDSWTVGGITTLHKLAVLHAPPAILRLELRRMFDETLKQADKEMSVEKLQEAAEGIFRGLANDGQLTIRPQFTAREVRRRLEYVRDFAQHTAISVREAIIVLGKWGVPITNIQPTDPEAYAFCLFDETMDPQAIAIIGPTGKKAPPTWIVAVMRSDPQVVHGVCLSCDAVFAREFSTLSHRAWDIPEHERLDKTGRCPEIELGPA